MDDDQFRAGLGVRTSGERDAVKSKVFPLMAIKCVCKWAEGVSSLYIG